MKIDNLMIGDWISRNGKPEQVDWTFMYCFGSAIEAGWKEEEMASVEFIPLTKEMLEINGFEHRDNFWVHRIDDNPSHYDFKLTDGGSLGSFMIDLGIYILFVNHVHKLQHLLRLCEKYDFADKFKIK